MIVDVVVYKTSTGQIVKSLSCPDNSLAVNAGEGESAIVDSGAGNDDTSYVDTSTSPHSHVPKTALTITSDVAAILANGIATATISSIPAGVFVTWPDGVREEVTDGVVEFATFNIGTHTLSFDGVTYLRKEIVIEANIE